jgi:hypothetical protein
VRVNVRAGLISLFLFGCGGAFGCAHGPDAGATGPSRQLIYAYDDNRATASLTFPSLTYESIVRFELPSDKHRLFRLLFMAESVGTVRVTFYENALLECPGEEIHTVTRDVGPDDVSNGKDGRWVVQDLQSMSALKGVVWIGLRKVGGTPALWTSAAVSGQTYLRDLDPTRAIGLLPVKRTPMIRLEVLP